MADGNDGSAWERKLSHLQTEIKRESWLGPGSSWYNYLLVRSAKRPHKNYLNIF
jgi:hypothetical protein